MPPKKTFAALTGENEANSNFFKYTHTRSGIQIDKYVGSDSFVVIPEEIEGLPVTSIGYRAFDNENLYKVIIPASVQTIVYAAFVSKQSMHVLFKGESIQLMPQSFITHKITFYFYNAIIYDSIYPITKNNPKYVIHYDAMDFRMV